MMKNSSHHISQTALLEPKTTQELPYPTLKQKICHSTNINKNIDVCNSRENKEKEKVFHFSNVFVIYIHRNMQERESVCVFAY